MRWITFVVCALTLGAPLAARNETLELRHVTLDVPGPPARILSSDIDGDGRADLAVVVAYTEIESIGESRIEDLIEISSVIPALFDRRELRFYRSDALGSYQLSGPPLPLPRSVLHLEAGPSPLGLIALTDEGLSRVRYDPQTRRLALEPWIAEAPVLAGTETFYTSLELLRDLDGDGVADLLFPSRRGLLVYPGTRDGLSREAASRIELPSYTPRGRSNGSWTHVAYPMPRVEDLNGDARPDLLFGGQFQRDHAAPLHVLLGQGGARFRPLRQAAADCHDTGTDVRYASVPEGQSPWPQELVAFRDLNDDGRPEAVLVTYRERGEGFRKSMKDAKRPIVEFAFHRTTDEMAIEPEPYHVLEAVGHSLSEIEGEVSGLQLDRFRDLDGDGRDELITMTLDFSMFQVLKVLVSKKIGMGLNFHIYSQKEDGSFQEVRGLDLSEKLRFDLNNLKLGRFAQFAGDFDGDGMQDFAHLGRGRKITLHRGQPGGQYPKNPDLSIELDEEPPSLDLVSIEDIDDDGRSDIRITRPLPATDPDTTAPTRVDLYLSGDGK